MVYQLRAQGLTTREIETTLKPTFQGQETPSDTQIWRWLTDPEADALVKREESKIRAVITQRVGEILPDAYSALAEAVSTRNAKDADAYSRAVVNMTRGFVREQLDVSTGERKVDAVDELTAIALRHGIRLEPGQQADATSGEKPSSNA